jgi:hypothetical protein
VIAPETKLKLVDPRLSLVDSPVDPLLVIVAQVMPSIGLTEPGFVILGYTGLGNDSYS